MLIDFTVENYRSIKEPVTLSAVAQHRPKSRPRDVESPAASARRLRVVPDDEIAAPFPVPGHDFELLPVLAIFGANASGKSNVLRARRFMQLLEARLDGYKKADVLWDTLLPLRATAQDTAESPATFTAAPGEDRFRNPSTAAHDLVAPVPALGRE